MPLSGGGNSRLNLDGYLIFTGGGGQPSQAYTQLYRNGIVESVHVYPLYGEDKSINLPSTSYERIILTGLSRYLQKFRNLGIEPPIYIFLALTGVANSVFVVPPGRDFDNYTTVDRDELILPEITIEEYGVEPALYMKPLFDMIWNAYGFRKSLNYDDQGKWNNR
jgi:hypothetical protein